MKDILNYTLLEYLKTKIVRLIYSKKINKSNIVVFSKNYYAAKHQLKKRLIKGHINFIKKNKIEYAHFTNT